MIQIILLIFGIIACVRFPRLLRITPAAFPEVEPARVMEWRSAEKAAAIWLIIASLGVFIVQIAVGLMIGVYLGVTQADKATVDRASMIMTISGLALFLALLVVAGIYGSKAKKLKEAAGIVWPKKK